MSDFKTGDTVRYIAGSRIHNSGDVNRIGVIIESNPKDCLFDPKDYQKVFFVDLNDSKNCLNLNLIHEPVSKEEEASTMQGLVDEYISDLSVLLGNENDSYYIAAGFVYSFMQDMTRFSE